MTSFLDETSFLYNQNADFISDLYLKYLQNPNNVDSSWRIYFDHLKDDSQSIEKELKGASWGEKLPFISDIEKPIQRPEKGAKPSKSEDLTPYQTQNLIRLLTLIRSYRVRGHLNADLDPLKQEKINHHPDLDPVAYGFTPEDMGKSIYVAGLLGFEQASPNDILERLNAIYASNIGFEFMHIQDLDKRNWLQTEIESGRFQAKLPNDDKLKIYKELLEAESFERFLHVKYVGTKRFGLEGGEAMIPALEETIAYASRIGIEEIVIGMAHRGRLNVLTNTIRKSYTSLFSQFQGGSVNPNDVQGSGDVKYHLGASADRVINGNKVHLSLTPNPSHLEAVDPVVVGKVRAIQQDYPQETNKALGILLHGDAAFAGQGIVSETLCLSELEGYKTDGTLHFIINNQIGFTTKPKFSRSTPYPSDVAKGAQAPIIHVNGDDPEMVFKATRLALEYRQKFKSDIILDMFCYRRYGHNESDEPAFTQPLMYAIIRKQPSVKAIYEDRLKAEFVLSDELVQEKTQEFLAKLEADYQAAQNYAPDKAEWLQGQWSHLTAANGQKDDTITGVNLNTLKEIGTKLAFVPDDFNINPKLTRLMQAKKAMMETGAHIDWAMGEALAFGSLLLEGHIIRLSGQDSGRGTFSHRHAILYDQENEKKYIPLNNINEKQSRFEVYDSPLSEFAVLGFEYGYSITQPDHLVLWEGQFGDFANGAQVIIDQFISSAESKWLRMSGLVMLLPHGYEGQGPEHSSARLERYLQLCAENNMQVVNCTTPASYFHVLRRQLKRNYRKPLIVMTPKSLLRLDLAQSTLADLAEKTSFKPVIGETDDIDIPSKVNRIVLCSGKVYYDLIQQRRASGLKNVAILRLEQLYPFPEDQLKEAFKLYPNAEMIWCQEEPKNMGAWFFVDRRLEEVLSSIQHQSLRPIYVGRAESASTAAGREKIHIEQQKLLVKQALGLKDDVSGK
ncbi:MAG: 2-oxoglutarate dehydrogenase E1 component [Alphaproteobacteria bacterium]|nr:2-oxoglutarate dehydrogenase E1 component [Alphaproteobacteria bacterium]